MGARTVKHNDHEHVVKSVKGNFNGLVFDDQTKPTDSIMQALGGTDEQFDKLIDKMVKYFKFVNSQEELMDDENLPSSTKLSLLVDFLNSPSFKMLGFPLKDPNHFFILGWIWGIVLTKRAIGSDTMTIGSDDVPAELRGAIIKMIKKKLREEEE